LRHGRGGISGWDRAVKDLRRFAIACSREPKRPETVDFASPAKAVSRRRRWPRDQLRSRLHGKGSAEMVPVHRLPNTLKDLIVKHIETVRVAIAKSRDILKKPPPDSFVGRKTQEPFPKEEDL
jgi:hypothetical protein